MVGWALIVSNVWVLRHTTKDAWVQAPSNFVLGQIWRVGIGSLGFLLAFVWRSRCYRALARVRSWRGAWRLVAIGIALLAAVTFAQRILRHMPLQFPVPEHGLPRSDGSLGWDYPPSQLFTFTRDRPRYAFGALGDRIADLSRPVDLSKPTLVFAGESTTMGWGVPYEQTFAALVGKKMGIASLNLGVQGFSTGQSYLKLIQVLPKVKHPVAVITFFSPVILRRNIDANRVHLVLDPAGKLVRHEPNPSWIREPRLRQLVEMIFPFHIEDPIPVTAATIQAIADATRARGAIPIFLLLLPQHARGFDPPSDDALLQAIFPDPKLQPVLIRWEPAWKDRSDVNHPSSIGTAAIAARLVEALRAAGVAP